MKNALCCLALTLVLPACATNNRNKILSAMAVAGVAGAVYGFSKQNNPGPHAVMYGALSSATAGAAGVIIWNSDTELERLRSEASAFSAELDRIRTPKRVLNSPATFGAKIPSKYRSLVEPGSWRVSEIDQWVEDGENRILHQDTVMELVPPSLNPSRSSGGTK